MPKPFLAYEQQIEKLKNKRLIIEDEAYATLLLHRHSYFALVSGYKGLLKNPTTKDYRDGTTFGDLFAVYSFDEQLRELTFHYLLHIERHIRSAISYAFCDKYGESQSAYLTAQNFDTSTKQKAREVNILISKYLTPLISNPTSYPYIEHQKAQYNNVPLWVLVNALTFGTVSKMYEFSTSQIQSVVSKEFDKLNEAQLRQMLKVLTDFRNVCAHSDRLYNYRCAKHDIPDTLLHQKLRIPKRGKEYIYGKRDYFALIIAFCYMLPREEFLQFKRSLSKLISMATKPSHHISEGELLAAMGMPANWKAITRYKK